MNIGATKQSYNNQTYETYMFIYGDDVTLSSPDLIANDSVVVVPTDEITYMMFENSIDDFTPKAEFEIKDDGHALANRLKAQNCRVSVTIEKSGRGRDGQDEPDVPRQGL